MAPSAVILLGGVVVLAMTFLGRHQLSQQAEAASHERAELLATAVAARIGEPADVTKPADPATATAAASQEAAKQEAALRRAAEVGEATLLWAIDDHLRASSPNQPLTQSQLRPLLVGPAGARSLTTAEGSALAAFVALGPKHSRVIALVPLESPDVARGALAGSLVVFATLLLAATGFVAWALARDVQADVLFVRRQIVNMAAEDKETEGHLIPVRTIDQVGQLTASFNMLLDRFHAAERAYRQDLTVADGFDRDRTAFLAALSHELRTPLNAILGFTDVLLNEIDGPLSDDARENLTIVRTSGEHLRSLIDDILTLSALESGEFRLSPEDLDIAQVAQDIVTEARVTAEQKGLVVELTRHGEPGETNALADRRRMRQVLGNVVSNAVKFTSRGSVKVDVRREGNHVVTTVTDTGPGIAESARERIFAEFEQSAAGTAQRTGTGLGLSITKRLVNLHGGEVSVDSELGVGSTFTIRIPVEPAPTTFPNLLRGMREPLITHRDS
ncbi:MAG TPA: HAMP domain-containing sensor histidine kinase [Polyangiaceae bacterium]|nr:HAMP domain-containing sensor histidine kinase [Polyangiaceae bacterium]